MATNFHKIKNGTNLQPNNGSLVQEKGDIAYNSAGNKVEVFTTTVVETLATDVNTLTLTNKTLTAPVISTISNTGTLTLPTSTDTLVGRATTDTLTNKTLTAPVISTISNTGTLTLPTSTDTLVGRATTDTLTNKSISGATNTITNVSLTSGITGTLPVANGGTNATTKAGAFDSLSPMTTAGDLIYGGASGTGTRLPGGADNQVLKYVAGVPTWSTFSNNGINYISSNPDAETSTAGWSLYQDLAGVSPVDGTGVPGSDLTFTRTTSSPLRGAGSFSMVQANSTSVQGYGVSFPFVIDNADAAKPLVVSFDYNASASFTASSGQVGSESDVEVYLYDVTNAILIPVSPKVLVANGANNFSFSGSFQTSSNSTSYKLLLHCATANAPATGFELKFDNVFVGPQAISHGAAITDAVPYVSSAPSPNLPGAVTTYYQRIGDSIRVTGTNVVSSGATGLIEFSIPNGLTIDTTKLSSANQLVGMARANNSGTIYEGYATVNSPTTVIFSGVGSASGGWTNSQPFTWGAGSILQVEFTVPIAGWSSTVEMSQDTDTRVVAAKYVGTGGSDIALVGFSDGFRFDSKEYDTHSAVLTGAAWRYIAPVSGIYEFSGNMYQISGNTDVYLFINGASGGGIVGQFNGGTAHNNFKFSKKLTAGDYVQLIPQNNCTQSDNALYNRIEVARLSGPATIAASETVAFRAMNASPTCANTVSGSDPVIFPSLGTFGFDTHGGYNTTTGEYKVPVSGIYRVTGSLQMNQAGGLDFRANLHLQKNGASFAGADKHHETGTSINMTPIVTSLIKCVAGDLLRPVPVTDAAGTIGAIEIYNFFEVEKIGN